MTPTEKDSIIFTSKGREAPHKAPYCHLENYSLQIQQFVFHLRDTRQQSISSQMIPPTTTTPFRQTAPITEQLHLTRMVSQAHTHITQNHTQAAKRGIHTLLS